jgi:hypothetical protein
MELIIYAGVGFLVGLTCGCGLFVFGVVVGAFLDAGFLRPKPKQQEEYDPAKPEVVDDHYFEMALKSPEEGGHPFPTDEELAKLHRHSSY